MDTSLSALRGTKGQVVVHYPDIYDWVMHDGLHGYKMPDTAGCISEGPLVDTPIHCEETFRFGPGVLNPPFPLKFWGLGTKTLQCGRGIDTVVCLYQLGSENQM